MSSITGFLLQYLLNSLWQIPLLAAAGLLIARALRPCGAAAEHRLWVGVLYAEVILPACSVNPLPWLGRFLIPAAGTGPSGDGQVTIHLGPGVKLGVASLPHWLTAPLTLAYLAVVVYFALRLLWGAYRTAGLCRSARPAVMTAEAEAFLVRCRRHFQVSATPILTPTQILGPITLGFRAVILLPADMPGQLPDEDLRTVLAHEFAHIARHDFARNLFYEALSLPLLYHPVFHLTRTRLVDSREVLCDRLAATLLASPQVYARSLVRLAARLVHGRSVRLAHAIGIFDANRFERRVMKLTANHPTLNRLRSTALVAAAGLLGLATCTSALALRATLQPAPLQAAPRASALGPAAQNGALQVAAGNMAANILTKVAPHYPQEAKDARIQGAVLLHAIIGKDGTIQNLTVISGPPELQASALDAVRQWVYRPYLLNGEPTEVETTITINYSIGR